MSVPAIERHLDTANADLGQSAGSEARPAKWSVTVRHANTRRLTGDVECRQLFRRHHGAGALKGALMPGGRYAPFTSLREGALDDIEVGDAAGIAREGHRRRQVRQTAGGVSGQEGIVFRAQEAAATGPLIGQN